MGYKDWPQVYGDAQDGSRYIILAEDRPKVAYIVDLEAQHCTCGAATCGHIEAAEVALAYFNSLGKFLGMDDDAFAAFYEKWWGIRREKQAQAETQGELKAQRMEAFYAALAETWRLRRKPDWREVNTVMGGALGYLFDEKDGK